jgi:putative ABC transport system substrate-binding protein
MRRREFIAGIGATAALPLAARAQQTAMPIVGFMSGRSPEDSAHLVAAFRQGLTESSFVEGQNLMIEYRWAAGRYDQLSTFAADLVGRKVDVIVAGGATDAARAAQAATSTIPIIFINGSDPVADGLVTSLARPSSNLTGVTFLAQELNGKLFQLLHELVPQARGIALLLNQTNSTSERQMLDLQEVARLSGVELYSLGASNEFEIDDVFGSLVQRRASGLIVVPEAFFANRRNQIVSLAARHAIPAVYGFREFAAAGGLISYGASFSASFRQAGIYAGRILKGAKPADLPVMQPTTFELVLNLKPRKTLS